MQSQWKKKSTLLRKQRVSWWRLKKIYNLQKQFRLLILEPLFCGPLQFFKLFLQDFSEIKVLYQEKARYEGVMTTRVLPDIEMAEAQYRELEENRKVHFMPLYLCLFM